MAVSSILSGRRRRGRASNWADPRFPLLHPARSRSVAYLKLPVLRTGVSGLDGSILLLRVRFAPLPTLGEPIEQPAMAGNAGLLMSIVAQ
jgi:hypothetical protein